MTDAVLWKAEATLPAAVSTLARSELSAGEVDSCCSELKKASIVAPTEPAAVSEKTVCTGPSVLATALLKLCCAVAALMLRSSTVSRVFWMDATSTPVVLPSPPLGSDSSNWTVCRT